MGEVARDAADDRASDAARLSLGHRNRTQSGESRGGDDDLAHFVPLYRLRSALETPKGGRGSASWAKKRQEVASRCDDDVTCPTIPSGLNVIKAWRTP